MDSSVQRRRDLETQQAKAYKMLADLEAHKQTALNDPITLEKFSLQIDGLKAQIAARQSDLDSFERVLDPDIRDALQLYLAASFARDERAELDQAERSILNAARYFSRSSLIWMSSLGMVHNQLVMFKQPQPRTFPTVSWQKRRTRALPRCGSCLTTAGTKWS